MPRGPKAVPLDLTEAERSELRRLLRRRGVGQALAQRVRVVLACAEPGATDLGVARALGVSRQTVATWRGRFAEHRLGGLGGAPRSAAPRGTGAAAPAPGGGRCAWRGRGGRVGAPRSGPPRSIGDAAVERLVALTLEEAPRGATHWSTRSMARRAGMSQTAVSRIWRAFGLRPHRAGAFQLRAGPGSAGGGAGGAVMGAAAGSRIWRACGLRPHRAETFKLSSDPAFVGKVRDIVGLYLAPPERALVLCVDGKPQIQAARGTAPAFPMRPGQPERRTHDHKRHGARDLS